MEDFEYINKELGTNFASNSFINWNNVSSNKNLTEKSIKSW